MKPAILPSHYFRCLLPIIGLLFAAGCTMRETGKEGPSLAPQFELRAVKAASLGTLDVLPLHEPSDVDLPRRNQLIDGYVHQNLPLKMILKVNAFNPSLESATTITSLDYRVMIDGKDLGPGRLDTLLELPANDSVQLSLSFKMNTYKLLGKDAMRALRNFSLGFGDMRRKRVTLLFRPQIRSSRSRFSSLIRRPPLVAPPTADAADRTNHLL